MKNFIVSLVTSIIVVTLFLFMNQAGFIPWDRVIKPVYEIPDLKGLSESDAEVVCRVKNISLKTTGEAYSTEYPAGLILSQAPESYSKSAIPQVKVILSKGTALIYVPDLKKLSFEEAVKKLREFSLLPGTKDYIYSIEVEKDKVSHTSPVFGTEVNLNDVVDIIISKGKRLTTVPRITGKKFPEAQRLLKSKGLIIGTIKKTTDIERMFDIVLKQFPPAGRKVLWGTPVTIVINEEE